MQVDHIAPMGGHLGGPTGSRPDRNNYPASTRHVSPATESAEASSRVTTKAMKAGDVFPDLHHKMSKKIAQLTKVIYHLNTKNEDRQARTRYDYDS